MFGFINVYLLMIFMQIKSISVLLIFTLIILPCFALRGETQQSTPKIGVLAKGDNKGCLEKWRPTAEYLTEQIPEHRFEIVPLDFDEVSTAVVNRRIDFMLVNPSLYVEIEIPYGANRITTLKNVEVGGVYTIYGGVIFYRSDRQDIKELSDLKGKKFMAVDENSLGGWRAVWRELKQSGINPYRDFGELGFGVNEEAVVRAVRDGRVDAGTVRTGILERMAEDGEISLEDFKVLHEENLDSDSPFLHSTRLYPEWPFAELKHTSDELAKKVAIALMKMPPDSPAAKAANCAGWTVPLNYQPVRDCLKELRVGPYKDFGKVTFKQITEQYWRWFVTVMVLLVVMTVTTVWVLRLNSGLKQTRGKLERELSEREGVEKALQKLTHDLQERVKELNCLFSIAKIVEKWGASLEAILEETVELIPDSWQYPEITCAGIKLEDRIYKTENFRQSPWRLSSDIRVRDKISGVIEVYYLEERPEIDEGPYLLDERKLIDAIAERLGRIAERILAKEEARIREQQLIHADKMVSLGTLVSGIAHEINNPNNFIVLNAPMLSQIYEKIMPILDEYYEKNGDFMMGKMPYSCVREKVADLLAGIYEGSQRIKRIVDSLKDFARESAAELSGSVGINSVVEGAVTLLENLINKSTSNFSVNLNEDIPPVKGDLQRLEQVVINLLQNSCQALPGRGRGIHLSTAYDESTNSAVITLRDEGVGIEPENIEHLTDPFFTTKRDYGGTGLGLSVSSRIIRDHGGTLNFISTPGEGTTAVVRVPCEPKEMVCDSNVRKPVFCGD